MSKRLYEKIYSLVKEWEPEEIYEVESDYRDDLLDFLEDELNDSDHDAINSGHISIKKENGRGLCDIGINRQIGIELKLDLDKKAQANRLVGQIMEYVDDYPIGIIVLLLGDTEHNAYQTVKDGIRKIQSDEQEFRVIRKKLDNSEEGENNSRDAGNPFGLNYGANPFANADEHFKKMNDDAKRLFFR